MPSPSVPGMLLLIRSMSPNTNLILHLAFNFQKISVIALAKMLSLSSSIRFERLSTKLAPNIPGVTTTINEIPTKKKQMTKTKENNTAIAKSIVLPTPSTPTRYSPPAPTSTAY